MLGSNATAQTVEPRVGEKADPMVSLGCANGRRPALSAFSFVALLTKHWGPYFDCLRRDLAIHCFVLCYIVAALLLGLSLGAPHRFAPLSYAAFVCLICCAVAAMGVYSLRSPTPLRAFTGQLRCALKPEVVSGILLFVSVAMFMGVFSSVKSLMPDIVPFYADPYLADLDRAIHGRAPWRYATAWLPPQWTPALEAIYFPVFGLLVAGAMLAVLVVPKLRHIRTQYVWSFLFCWILLGNFLACAFMSAGPNYYDDVTGNLRFIGLEQYLERNSIAQTWAKEYLLHSHVTKAAGAGTGISAFPSMHLSMAAMLVLLAGKIGRLLMCAAAIFCAVILFGSVHLGWHYAVDGYVSIGATLLIWKSVGRFLARRETRSSTLTAAPIGCTSCAQPMAKIGVGENWEKAH